MFKTEVSSHARAAMYMLLCTFGFASMTALIKGLKHLPLEQIIFFRCFVALLFPLSYLILRGQIQVLKTKRFSMHLIRAGAGLSAMYCYFTAFTLLPLVEAHAFGRSKAIFISLCGILLLKEKLTKARIAAVSLGFLGVLIMLNPGAPSISIGVLYALAGAVLAALAMTCVSILTRTEHPLAIVIYFMVIGSLASFGFALSEWQALTLSEYVLLAGVGFLGVFGQVFMVLAYKSADASYVAPFDYIELAWASILGFLFWSEIPTLFIVVGTFLIICSQIYMHRSERRS